MISSLTALFIWLFVAACVAVWYYLGVSAEVAFLLVGAAIIALAFWRMNRQPKAHGSISDAKFAQKEELKRSGFLRDR